MLIFYQNTNSISGLIIWGQDNFVFSDVEMFGDEEQITNHLLYFDKTLKILRENPYPNKLIKYFKNYNLVPTFSVVMCKKDELMKCDFNTPLDAVLDSYLWVQMAKNNMYYLDEKLTQWRMHKTSYINNHVKNRNRFDEIKLRIAIDRFIYPNRKIQRFFKLVFLYLKEYKRSLIKFLFSK